MEGVGRAPSQTMNCPVCTEEGLLLRPPGCPHAVCVECARATWLCVPPVCTLCGRAAAEDGGWVPLDRVNPGPPAAGGLVEAVAAALADVQRRCERVAEAAGAARDAARLWVGAGYGSHAGLAAVLAAVDAEERSRLKALGAQTDELQVRLALVSCAYTSQRLEFAGLGGRPLGPPVPTFMEVVVVEGDLRLRRRVVDLGRCLARTWGVLGPVGREAVHDPVPKVPGALTVEVELADEFGRRVMGEEAPVVVVRWRGRDMGPARVTDTGTLKFEVALAEEAVPPHLLVRVEEEGVLLDTVRLEARRAFEGSLMGGTPLPARVAGLPAAFAFGTASLDGVADARVWFNARTPGEQIFLIRRGTTTASKLIPRDLGGVLVCARFGPGPEYNLYAVHTNGRVWQFSLRSPDFVGMRRVVVGAAEEAVDCLALSADGRLAVGVPGAVACYARREGMWRELWRSGSLPDTRVQSLDFSVGGRRLVAVVGTQVVVLDAQDGRLLRTFGFRANGDRGVELRFFRNGQAVIAEEEGLYLLKDDLTGVARRLRRVAETFMALLPSRGHAATVVLDGAGGLKEMTLQ